MKNLAFIFILALSLANISNAKAVIKNNWWSDEILVIEYNGERRMFAGWNKDAKYFWDNGSLPPHHTDSIPTMAVNNNISDTPDASATVIKQQADTIGRLRAENALLRKKLADLETKANIHIWKDIEGNSFAGTLIGFELGEARIRRLSDSKEFLIPEARLAPESAALAKALGSLSKPQ
ncbi:hypothetical protein [Cerasicoccus arenae]|uniref:Uncharacterized protein n=1 Tax=Cerasicoccus arenae TaxID=424488 RepID=A0A8J3DA58_9BACT|nr:hypothetical protein [Cerasicoccus arenae]MBK1859338.1 hypothetical protein [Cerasicoccus arenae]GHB93855.1 hypothetical protein GCM10007047_06770 [Cerasicoccus arenae]